MSRRDDILREMGLVQWRLRADAFADAPAAAQDEAQGSETLQPPAMQPAPVGAPPEPVAGPRAEPVVDAANVAAMDWSALEACVRACTACGLCKGRTQAVFGVGDQNADWLFVGEGPGAEEDARGEPFVGQAGRLLDNMLAAIQLKRGEDVYIANIVKCRPPGNRVPEPAEADACKAYLRRQIALLAPKLIVALGKTAASNLLASDSSIAGLRGRVHDYNGIPLLVTYHPAYLLRNLPDKAKSWEDLCRARALMDTFKRGA